ARFSISMGSRNDKPRTWRGLLFETFETSADEQKLVFLIGWFTAKHAARRGYQGRWRVELPIRITLAFPAWVDVLSRVDLAHDVTHHPCHHRVAVVPEAATDHTRLDLFHRLAHVAHRLIEVAHLVLAARFLQAAHQVVRLPVIEGRILKIHPRGEFLDVFLDECDVGLGARRHDDVATGREGSIPVVLLNRGFWHIEARDDERDRKSVV